MLLAKKKNIKKNFSFKFFFYILTSILLLLIVLIYNEKPQNFNPANTLPQFIRLVENKKYNAWEDLCDGSFSISNNLQPDEGCGGILEVS